MGEWKLLIDQPLSAAEQMATDEQLAQRGASTARFFGWQPEAISLGWKQPRPEWFESDRWHHAGFEWVERPTGGGIAFHGSDVSIAVIVPRALGMSLSALMRAICQSAVTLCASYGAEASALLDVSAHEPITYCLTQRSSYAVLINERKVAGFALRRYPTSWLMQGSLLVNPLPEALQRMVPVWVREDIRTRATSLSTACGTSLKEDDVKHRWATHWTHWWEQGLLETVGAQMG